MGTEIAYWNQNIPRAEWSVECPDFLKDVDHWDQAQLAVKDADYELMSWDEVKDIVSKGSDAMNPQIQAKTRQTTTVWNNLRELHPSFASTASTLLTSSETMAPS